MKHDISIPISRIVEFVEHTDALLQQHFPGVRNLTFGHLGDGTGKVLASLVGVHR